MTQPAVSPTQHPRLAAYTDLLDRVDALLDGETDWIAAMSTVACELHHTFDYFDWTGFYRAVSDDLLVVGPYQGGHGCLRIPFDQGVCGAAARMQATQFVPDVHEADDHIACSASTQSEVVVPILTPGGTLLAVLDVDSDTPDAFTEVDRSMLERLAEQLGRQFEEASQR